MDRRVWLVCRRGSPGRRRARAAALVAVIFLSVLAGCGGSGGGAATQPVEKGAADDGQAVTLSQGQELRVRLEGNPTTGFTWEVQNLPAVLEAKGEPVYVSGGTAIGSGGTYTFTFAGKQAGDGQLTLIYHRTFETGVPPEQTYTLKVTVK